MDAWLNACVRTCARGCVRACLHAQAIARAHTPQRNNLLGYSPPPALGYAIGNPAALLKLGLFIDLVRLCARACARACVHACMRACVCACACVRVRVWIAEVGTSLFQLWCLDGDG